MYCRVIYNSFVLSIIYISLFLSGCATPGSSYSGTANDHYNYALKAFEKGNIDTAILYSRKAIEIDHSFGIAHYNLGIFTINKKEN